MDEGFAALSALLGDKRYFLGFQPCVADASVFGLLDRWEPLLLVCCLLCFAQPKGLSILHWQLQYFSV
jgi:glutathione S-transferase